MHEVFCPQSVAVIGVSDRPSNLGRVIITNLIEFGYNGKVYAIGPSGGCVRTHSIYPAISEVPGPVDLAVILTPAKTVAGVLEECGLKGVRWAIIETAGFREYGEEGRKLEGQILQTAEHFGIRFIGPNCFGVINTENKLCVPFLPINVPIQPGEVSIISQSGGVGVSIINLLTNDGIGLNKFISVGNMLNISAVDALEYLLEDPGTRVIFLYLENLDEGRRLMELARHSPKPILVFKANIGQLGKAIAASHTASLSSDDKVAEEAFRQAGILRVVDATSLVNDMKALQLPPLRGKNLVVISRSGGHAVVGADTCELSGFNLVKLPDSFFREVEKHFRASVIKLTNPLDLGDLYDIEVYGQILEQVLQLEEVDGVVFMHTALSDEEILVSRKLLERLIELVKRYNKPVAYYTSTNSEEIKYLRKTYGYPLFSMVVETIRAMEASYRIYHWRQEFAEEINAPVIGVDRATVERIINEAVMEERDLLLPEAVQVLESYGIPAVKGVFAVNREQACAEAKKLGYPVAIKVVSGQISHKSDVGGVRLNLHSRTDVAQAFDEMLQSIAAHDPQTKVDGVLVQPMVSGGQELILGGRQDPNFGPLVLVGLGGIFVEVLNEVALRVAPITQQEAQGMIEQLRGAAILKGARGSKPADIDAVVQALLQLSQLLVDFPHIREIDINPLRVFEAGKGCCALDARVMIGTD